jgi:putative ABC transport system ATP-binding protein
VSTGGGFRFEGVGVVIDGAPVLSGIDVAFGDGGVTVIAGPSGSGKTTLLRLCNRLEVPSSGRVLLDGVDLATLDPLVVRRRVGMVFQRPVVFGGTVRDNLAVADDAHDDRLAGALGRAGLDASFLDRTADDLSGGEAQRMCIARALLTDPEVLLMDEPTSALDPEHRLVIEDLARSLADDGTPVVWVTHDLAQARRLADRTAVLVGGTVADPDTATRFLAYPTEAGPADPGPVDPEPAEPGPAEPAAPTDPAGEED